MLIWWGSKKTKRVKEVTDRLMMVLAVEPSAASTSTAADAQDEDTDYGAVQAGYISVTPVRLDLTARDLLGEVAGYVPEVEGSLSGAS